MFFVTPLAYHVWNICLLLRSQEGAGLRPLILKAEHLLPLFHALEEGNFRGKRRVGQSTQEVRDRVDQGRAFKRETRIRKAVEYAHLAPFVSSLPLGEAETFGGWFERAPQANVLGFPGCLIGMRPGTCTGWTCLNFPS